MSNKAIGYNLFVGIGIAIVGFFADESSLYNFSDFLYTMSGLWWLVFGAWAGGRLIKMDN